MMHLQEIVINTTMGPGVVYAACRGPFAIHQTFDIGGGRDTLGRYTVTHLSTGWAVFDRVPLAVASALVAELECLPVDWSKVRVEATAPGEIDRRALLPQLLALAVKHGIKRRLMPDMRQWIAVLADEQAAHERTRQVVAHHRQAATRWTNHAGVLTEQLTEALAILDEVSRARNLWPAQQLRVLKIRAAISGLRQGDEATTTNGQPGKEGADATAEL